MEKISSIISKKVISLQEGNLAGYVLDVVFDENLKTFEGLIVAESENENTFFLPRKDVISTGEDCVVIESESVLEYDISSYSNNPIGKDVYDEKGVFLGKVVEVELAGKNVKKIITKKCEIPQKFIQKAGANFIIFGITKKNKKNKNKTYLKENKKSQDINEKLPKVVAAKSMEISSENITTIQDQNKNQIRIFASPNSLIGRTITKDLFGMNNEIIAKENEKINKKIIKNAKNHNKLNFLSYFSR